MWNWEKGQSHRNVRISEYKRDASTVENQGASHQRRDAGERKKKKKPIITKRRDLFEVTQLVRIKARFQVFTYLTFFQTYGHLRALFPSMFPETEGGQRPQMG